ncbi:hypothetical protein SLS60_011913 [Paraconiothyrium brasiliense]|uniref:Uncharacterized protein n=1 Tax=Paraconiothyrium brasiliense TaxID=300254 RepID=A0ABR3QH83_9PLEO
MQDTVMRFLSQLQESLGQSLEIITGLDTPWEELEKLQEHQSKVDEATEIDPEEDDSDESGSSDDGNSELSEKLLEIEDTITHLYRLSFKMRNANYRSTSTRALSVKNVDPDTGKDLYSCFAEFDRKHVLESLQQLRRVPQTLSSGLQPAREVDTNVPDFLVKRLSEAMTNRRRYFAYWQKHAVKLSQITDGSFDRQIKLEAEAIRISGPETIISGTDISKYRNSLDDRLETDTVISYATTAKDVNGKSADLPPPPANASSKREFVCPYCKVGCPSSQGKGKSWRYVSNISA